MSGGGSAPSSQTVNQVSVPEYLRPYVESNVGRAGAITDWSQNPYQSYGGQQIAGFSPMQVQAMTNLASMAPAQQITDASNMYWGIGQQNAANQANALALQQQAQQMGDQAAEYAALGQQKAAETSALASGLAQTYGQAGYQNAAQTQQLATDQARRFGNLGADYGDRAFNLGSDAGSYALTQARDVGLGAQKYGQMGADYGAVGMGYGAQGASIGAQGVGAANRAFDAQNLYHNQATSPEFMGQYMSPYMQNVIDASKRETLRDYEVQQTGRNAQAVGSGAFGGSRQAIFDAEANRNLNTQLQDMQTKGLQSAYEQARQAHQFGADLGIRGIQTGLQGLQTGLQGTAQGMQGAQIGQAGAQIGLQGVGQQLAAGQLGLQGYKTGMEGTQIGQAGAQIGLQGVGQQLAAGQLGLQGAQTGLQGVDRLINAGQLDLAGTAQGIQGAQVGLQGIGQGINAAQYGLQSMNTMGNAASGLLSAGNQQYQQQMGINQGLLGVGGMQQQLQQQALDRMYQDYLAQLQYPYQQISYLQGIYQGLPMTQGTSSVYEYPNQMSQMAGLGTALYGASNMGRKEGGIIRKEASGIDALALKRALEDE